MGAPKSVIKMDKTGSVSYESNIDAAQYYIFELTRAALRDVGKYVAKQFKVNYYGAFHKKTGNAGRATRFKVWSSASTKFPRVQIGLHNAAKGFYSYEQEFGSVKTPRLGILTHAVEDNIAEIIKIESQYLSALNGDEGAIASMCDESEYEGDGE